MLDKVEKGVISNIYLVEPCHSMPQGCHKDGAPLDEVEKGAISNVYLRELGHSWTQEWRPAGWGWESSNLQVLPTRAGQLPATRMLPSWMRFRNLQSASFTYPSWATPSHKNGAPLYKVEKGAISKIYLPELDNSLPQNGARWMRLRKEQSASFTNASRATRMAPHWMRLRNKGSAIFTWVS